MKTLHPYTLNIKTLLPIFLLLVGLETAHAQATDWVMLSLVTFETVYDEALFMEVKKPLFSSSVLEMSGTEVTLDGFIYPLEGTKASDYFVLSSLPVSSCFFCGTGGPETVAEIHSQEKIPYTKERITLKGELILKKDDPSGVIYLLTNAVLVE